MSSEKLLNLVSKFNCCIPTGFNVVEEVMLTGRDIIVSRIKGSIPDFTFSAINNLFKNKRARFLEIRISRLGPIRLRLCFTLLFCKEHFESLYRILPNNAFIEIVVAKNSRNAAEGTVTTLTHRIHISELIRGDERLTISESTPTYSIHKIRLLSINLGWRTPSVSHSIKTNATTCMKNLFENSFSKDVTLVGANRAEIKCHSIILQGHSDVFAAMMSPEIGMKECQTGRIEMPENSEEGLQHLIRYLYGFELIPAGGLDCDVAVELFITAHKFKLTGLQDRLGELLLHSGEDWYNPDYLVELYFHQRNLDEYESLNQHLLGIMVNLYSEIRTCERMEEIRCTDPAAAAELFWKLFDMK